MLLLTHNFTYSSQKGRDAMRTKPAFTLFCLSSPIAALLINSDAFFIIMTLLILAVSSKSLKQLFILNFASDKAYEKYITKTTKAPCSNKELLLSRAIIFSLNALVVLFFIYTFFITKNIMLRITAASITAIWMFDIFKTIGSIYSAKTSEESAWNWRDNLTEAFMWLQNISSIIFIVILLALKLPAFAG